MFRARSTADQTHVRFPLRLAGCLVALATALAAPAQTLVLDTFGSGGATGAVISGSTWVGQTSQTASTLTVGGTATDVNGWQATDLSLNAGAMRSLVITARRDAGNAASTVFVQFEDVQLRTYVVSIDTSLFASGTLTSVAVPLTRWTVDFGPTQIVSWSLGGGGVGSATFHMTFDQMAFSTTAIPEPSTCAALLGTCAILGTLAHRRRRRRGA